MRPETADYNHDIDGDLLEVEDYLEDVKHGGFIDYDGFGYAVRDGMASRELRIYPSDGDRFIPLDATHIDWYNR